MIQSLTELETKSELDRAVDERLAEVDVKRCDDETYMELADRIEDAYPELANELRAAAARRNVLEN